MALNSTMRHNFSRVPGPEIQRSVFERPTAHKTTFNAGILIPFFVDEVLPGDTMNLDCNIFARLQTLIYPLMDNIFLDVQYFYTPSRLLWENWERFQGAQDEPTDPIDFLVPVMDMAPFAGGFGSGSIYDYFNLPVGVEIPQDDAPVSLPLRAYNLIWNEWYRDQNFQAKVSVPLGDGPDDETHYALLRRGKRREYLSSVLPWPQKGDAVAIPLGTTAPVVGNGLTLGLTDGLAGYGLGYDTVSSARATVAANWFAEGQGDTTSPLGFPSVTKSLGVTEAPAYSGLIALLDQATAITVNAFRDVIALQQYLERDARGGTRYVEILKARFGVDVPDFRLQRPEYLGGFTSKIDTRSVAQTSQSTEGNPQANLAAYGQFGAKGGFTKSFVEHGYVIGLVSVRADISYQGYMRKMWSRRTRYDYYDPIFAHLGEQAVPIKEVLCYDDTETNNTVFGYQERWAEYRYFPSSVTGLFRSNVSGTLDKWHLALNFFSSTVGPADAAFMEDNPPIERVIAVTTQPQILFDSFTFIRHARPIPVYSVPGLRRL